MRPVIGLIFVCYILIFGWNWTLIPVAAIAIGLSMAVEKLNTNSP